MSTIEGTHSNKCLADHFDHLGSDEEEATEQRGKQKIKTRGQLLQKTLFFSIVLFGDEALWKSGIKYETFILFQAKSDSYGQGRLFFPLKTHGLSIGLLPPSSKQEEELLHQQKKKHGPASLYSLFHGSPLSFHSSFAPSSQIFKSLQEVEKKREREEKQKIYRKEKNLFLFLWRALQLHIHWLLVERLFLLFLYLCQKQTNQRQANQRDRQSVRLEKSSEKIIIKTPGASQVSLVGASRRKKIRRDAIHA